MTRIAFQVGKDGSVLAVQAKGHAGFAAEGEDIVCAAVSALMQAAWIGLTDVVGVQPQGEIAPGDMRIAIDRQNCGAEALERAQIVLKTLYKGCQSIERGYPKYVKLNVTEVHSRV